MNNKILSIFIPTYNRGKLLEPLLENLISQINEVKDQVELVISNNSSKDNTDEIVRKFKSKPFVKYNLNERNLGGFKNIVLSSELCTGEYTLIIGDDDFIIKGKLAKVVEILKNNLDTDYFFLNYALVPIKHRNDILINKIDYRPKASECFSNDFEVKRIDKWENLYNINSKYAATMFTYLGCNLFRTSIWKKNLYILNVNDKNKIYKTLNDEYFPISLDYIFPHIKVISKVMKGKPCIYIGDPIIGEGIGVQFSLWGDTWDLVNIVVLNEIYDYYKKIAVDLDSIKPFEEALMINSGKYIAKKISNFNINKSEEINLERYINELSNNDIFLKSFIKECKKYMVNSNEKIYKDYSESFFENIIKYYKKIAIWGTGDITNSLIEKSNYLSNNIKFVIDSNIHRHGRIVETLNVIIQSPKVLLNEAVDLIIVGSIAYETEIVNEIVNMKLKCDVIWSKGLLRLGI